MGEIQLDNIIDGNNSTSTPLGIDGVFTGTGVDVSEHNNVTVMLFADKDSATNGMQFQFSTDNTNWDDCFHFTLTADEPRRFQYPVTGRYFRVIFTNGDTAQTKLRIQTILHGSGILTTIHRISDPLSSDNSAQLIKAILSGQKPGDGDFVNFGATTGGNFKTSVEEFNGSTLAPKSLVTSPSFALATDHYDENTRALTNISFEHHLIHIGDSFVVCDVQNVNATTIKWQITTPNTTKYSHVIFDIEATGEMLMAVTEGSDRTDGVALTEINRSRIGTPNVAGTIVTRTPTGGSTDGATTITSRRVGATGVASKTLTGGGNRGTNEFILKPNTKYVVAITTFADIYVTFCLDWYEYTSLSN